jgi:hypothetical protein
VSFITSRLRPVEAAARKVARCLECGLSPEGIGRIVYGSEPRPEGSEEFCPHWGRRLWFVIEVREAQGEGVRS